MFAGVIALLALGFPARAQAAGGLSGKTCLQIKIEFESTDSPSRELTSAYLRCKYASPPKAGGKSPGIGPFPLFRFPPTMLERSGGGKGKF